MDPRIASILDYWFGRPPHTRAAADQLLRRWFGGGPAVDREIEQRFSAAVAEAASGALGEWQGAAEGRLALILLLDQFPRHLYRGAPAAFEHDSKALELTLNGFEQGMERALPLLQRGFFCMPLQHAESLAVQERSIAVFEALRAQHCPPHVRRMLRSFADSARAHRDIIARFGRFPHRNRSLGRENTEHEQAFLNAGAPTFGQ